MLEWFLSLCETALMLSLSFIFTSLIGLLLIKLCGGTVHIAIFPEDEFREMVEELKDFDERED